jgi:Raf kinase inhibitor-like YbhB/YbcL family protein
MKLTSPRFAHEGRIPRDFTCQGRDVSPPLAWEDVPAGTHSLVLIVDDPDAPDPAAPRTVWVHWLLYNLPADLRALPEGVDPGTLPGGVGVGRNDFRKSAWGGPCPPVGRHRYYFRLTALGARLPDLGACSRSALEQAMASAKALGTAVLMGTYQKGD